MLVNLFAIPLQLQERVSSSGLSKRIVMRRVMNPTGAWLIAQLHRLLFVFGQYPLITGIKMW